MYKRTLYLLIKSVFWITALFGSSLAAHHGIEGGLTGSAVDPSTGASYKPQSRITWTGSHFRGARENKDILSSSVNGELVFGSGYISLIGEMPWYYYSQKGIPDASRYGKPRIGLRGRFLPDSESRFFFSGDALIGFPTGADTDTVTEEDYYDFSASVTGGFSLGRFAAALQAGNRQALTKKSPAKSEYDLLPVLPENYKENPHACRLTRTCPPDETELKNVYDGSLTVSASVFRGVSVFISQYARTPFDGILYRQPWPRHDYTAFSENPEAYYLNYLYNKKITNNPELPAVYYETSAGLNVKAADYLSVHLIYRFPNERRTHVRPYESSVSLGISLTGGSFWYAEGGLDE